MLHCEMRATTSAKINRAAKSTDGVRSLASLAPLGIPTKHINTRPLLPSLLGNLLDRHSPIRVRVVVHDVIGAEIFADLDLVGAAAGCDNGAVEVFGDLDL